MWRLSVSLADYAIYSRPRSIVLPINRDLIYIIVPIIYSPLCANSFCCYDLLKALVCTTMFKHDLLMCLCALESELMTLVMADGLGCSTPLIADGTWLPCICDDWRHLVALYL